MVRTFRRITRSGFCARLGLQEPDLTLKQGSLVVDVVTRFYDGNGQAIATWTRSKCPITGKFEDEFTFAVPTDEPEEAHSSLWL